MLRLSNKGLKQLISVDYLLRNEYTLSSRVSNNVIP